MRVSEAAAARGALLGISFGNLFWESLRVFPMRVAYERHAPLATSQGGSRKRETSTEASFLPQERLVHPIAFTRAAVVNSVRFTITEPGGTPVPPASMQKFLSLLSDGDLKVRRGALLALNCVAHNRPGSVREMLGGLLPMLYAETTKKAELVHQVCACPSTERWPPLGSPADLPLSRAAARLV